MHRAPLLRARALQRDKDEVESRSKLQMRKLTEKVVNFLLLYLSLERTATNDDDVEGFRFCCLFCTFRRHLRKAPFINAQGSAGFARVSARVYVCRLFITARPNPRAGR